MPLTAGGLRAQVSRDAPPPLPGGYKVGDKVFYTGAGYTFANGDKVVHGQQGEVMGPITREPHKGQGVAVCFPGNKRHKDCLLTEVRRLRAAPTAPPLPLTAGGLLAQVSSDAPPPLPSGYKVGEHVYFVAASQTTGLDHGMQGEVVGPALAGEGVLVSFPYDGKSLTPCYLNLVRGRPERVPPIAPRCPSCPRHSQSRVCRAGKPTAATASGGRIRVGRAGLLHGGAGNP